MSRLAAALVALAAALALPRVGEACAVCTGGQAEASQRAFLIGTALLTTLPLLLIGGVAFFLWRRARRIAAAEEAADSLGGSAQPVSPPGCPSAAAR